jgi:DNA-binding winged helix-turn-helix (wHTH) protein
MPTAAGSKNAQALKLGPWRIDLARGIVVADSEHDNLIPRAETLLLLLCRHANEVVTREQIHESVWSGRVVEDAAISNCIWHIRKSLGDRSRDILQTRAKRGYLLVVPENAWEIEAQQIEQQPIEQRSNDAAIDDAATRNAVRIDAETIESSLSGERFAANTGAAVEPGFDPISEAAPERQQATAEAASAQRASPPRRRRFALALAATLALFISAAIAWIWIADEDPPIVLRPEAEMTVAIIAPQRLNWLRTEIVRAAVEHAYLRDSEVVEFQKPQRRNPFAGPHLQVLVKSERHDEIRAELSIVQGQTAIRKNFRGHASGLAAVVDAMLVSALGQPKKSATTASDALVSGLVAELRHDNRAAIAEFERAIARDSGLADAKIAMARVFLEQGRWRQAFELVDRLMSQASLSAHQRCAISMLLADVAPDKVAEDACPRAVSIVKLNRLDLRDLLRDLKATRDRLKGATQWETESTLIAIAHIRLQELSAAESEIAQIERTARDAGWEHAVAELDAGRAMVAIFRGKPLENARLESSSADQMDAIGDLDSALSHRIVAIRAVPIVPGPLAEARRAQLHAIVDRAREIGSAEIEIDALHALLRLERDRPQEWSTLIARYRSLVADVRTPDRIASDLYKALDETQSMRRYREVLEGIAERERAGADDTQSKSWSLTLRAESHFARDELDAAVEALDAMRKENFDLADTSSVCLFSWLLVEARQPEPARTLLKRCQSMAYDRSAQASRGDHGLLAQARLFQREGDAARAWPVLAPRIDALIATEDMTRPEAESLAALARHATSMIGADRRRLYEALIKTDVIARRDGSSPGLQLGVHLLRWRLCATAGRTDCGPLLPEWAQEDLLEARLAREGGSPRMASR